MFIAHSHAQRRAACADGKRLIAQLSGQVKGFPQRLLLRQAQRVLLNLRLDARAHLTCGAEVPIRGGQALKSLMRSLEVVVLDVKPHSALAVLKVGKHRAAEQLLPQRLPEPLDLPAGLWMVWPALHMRDAVALQLRLELRAPAPRGVLPTLIRQDLPRGAVLGDPARERFQHQHASLVMRHRQAHQIPGVIVQERCHVNSLVASQQERKEIRLPQLVRLGTLEVLHLLLALHPLRRHLRLDAFRSQHPPHRRLGRAYPQEPAHHIADAAATRVRCLLMRRQGRLRPLIGRLLQARMQRQLPHFERLISALPIRLHPHHRGGIRHA